MNCFLHDESFIYDLFQVVVERSFPVDCGIVCWVEIINDFLVIYICALALFCIPLMVCIMDVIISAFFITYHCEMH